RRDSRDPAFLLFDHRGDARRQGDSRAVAAQSQRRRSHSSEAAAPEGAAAGMMDCKKALAESVGEVSRAIKYLGQKGLAAAAKKADRVAADGAVGAYVHPGGKIGVLVEINCETDFVARTAEFQTLLKDIAMQIAAANPRYLRREEVPAAELDKEKAIYRQ